MAGVSGRSRRADTVKRAVGRVRLHEGRRQGDIPVILLGAMVKVIA